jgi:hypothetical protein
MEPSSSGDVDQCKKIQEAQAQAYPSGAGGVYGGPAMKNFYGYGTLCLFLPTGKTFTFKNVDIVQDNESVLKIEYVAMSDGNRKVATFQKSQVVGYSIGY